MKNVLPVSPQECNLKHLVEHIIGKELQMPAAPNAPLPFDFTSPGIFQSIAETLIKQSVRNGFDKAQTSLSKVIPTSPAAIGDNMMPSHEQMPDIVIPLSMIYENRTYEIVNICETAGAYWGAKREADIAMMLIGLAHSYIENGVAYTTYCSKVTDPDDDRYGSEPWINAAQISSMTFTPENIKIIIGIAENLYAEMLNLRLAAGSFWDFYGDHYNSGNAVDVLVNGQWGIRSLDGLRVHNSPIAYQMLFQNDAMNPQSTIFVGDFSRALTYVESVPLTTTVEFAADAMTIRVRHNGGARVINPRYLFKLICD